MYWFLCQSYWNKKYTLKKIIEKYSYLALKGKKISFTWIPSHVGIPGNETADKAVKEVLNLPGTDLKIASTDFKHHINRYVKEIWCEEWCVSVHNKLDDIQPQLWYGHTVTENYEGKKQFCLEQAKAISILLIPFFERRINASMYSLSMSFKCLTHIDQLCWFCFDQAEVSPGHLHEGLVGQVDSSCIFKCIKENGLFYKLKRFNYSIWHRLQVLKFLTITYLFACFLLLLL